MCIGDQRGFPAHGLGDRLGVGGAQCFAGVLEVMSVNMSGHVCEGESLCVSGCGCDCGCRVRVYGR